MLHRRDIEGLRAFAILLVIAAHSKIPGLSGGFIGVDIFFVLSGYLITGLLLNELTQTGSLDFGAFFIRRFKRLLPGLIAVVTVTLCLASYFFQGTDLSEAFISGLTSLNWLSNLHFANSNTNYFAPELNSDLFLHTWSLAVEGQIYFFWPICLYLVARHKLTKQASLKISKDFNLFLIGVTGISFFVCLYWTYHSPSAAYFMSPVRLWQFSIGGICYVLCQHLSFFSYIQKYQTIFAWLSFLTLILAALSFHNLVYPGLAASIPSLASALLLLSCATPANNGIKRFLSQPLMQFIGQISYSWYLWHWPVIVFATYILDLNIGSNILGSVAISFTLAILSYYLLESPIRRLKSKNTKVALLSTLFIMLSINAGLILSMSQINLVSQNLEQKYAISYPGIYSKTCVPPAESSELLECRSGIGKKTLVLAGDSIGVQWIEAINHFFSDKDWNIIVLTKSACPMVDQTFIYPRLGRRFTECEVWRESAIAKIKQIRPDILIIGSGANYPFTTEQWRSGSRQILQQLHDTTRKFYVIAPTPELPFSPLKCQSIGLTSCTAKYNSYFIEEIFTSIKQESLEFSNLRFINLNDEICPNQTCQVYRQGLTIFRDKTHLNASYIRKLSSEFGRQLELD